ncbi:MAG: hypothetical protein IT160_19930 [Bryobacterales bacterium]|nr:hypothetical protein [Bryobacterales bacterium]
MHRIHSAVFLLAVAACAETPGVTSYLDGRPSANLRMPAKDFGVVLRHGDGPARCDIYGARDVWVWKTGGVYYMHYDAAGPVGWLAALATSADGVHWTKHGTVLELGVPGEEDAKAASYGTTFMDRGKWHMFYVGTPNSSPPPARIPAFPYLTMKAESRSPAGPWKKRPDIVPFRPQPGTYDSVTASPGFIVKQQGEYLQFFSAATMQGRKIRRGIGLARTRNLDGPWSVGPAPILPLDEQIENTSLYYEKSIRTWFLFTNHVGISGQGEYTDAVWVYWSRDLLHWDTANKAVVLDGSNCTWAKAAIGLPSVVPAGKRLAIYYDGLQGTGTSHMQRDVGLAYLDLPLKIPR